MATSARVARLLHEAAALRRRIAYRRRWHLLGSGNLNAAARICLGFAHDINTGAV